MRLKSFWGDPNIEGHQMSLQSIERNQRFLSRKLSLREVQRTILWTDQNLEVLNYYNTQANQEAEKKNYSQSTDTEMCVHLYVSNF